MESLVPSSLVPNKPLTQHTIRKLDLPCGRFRPRPGSVSEGGNLNIYRIDKGILLDGFLQGLFIDNVNGSLTPAKVVTRRPTLKWMSLNASL